MREQWKQGRGRSVLGALAALVLLVGAASATLVVRLDLPQLVSRAALVVEGRCLAVTASEDDRGVIQTELEFYVERGRKGSQDGEFLRFRVPGGSLSGRTLSIPGLPVFEPGDEAFLFLSAESGRGWRLPVGLGQGVYRMSRDPATGARGLARDLTGLEFVDAATGAAVDAPDRRQVAYSQLVAEVERLLADQH